MRWDTPQKTGTIFWRVGPLEDRLPPLGECSRNPSVSLYQLELLWEAVFGFSEFVWKILSMHLPISWWVIYERTCPHCTECSVVFDQKQHDPCAPPNLALSDFFLFPWMKKVLKGKCFANVEDVKQKMAEALKGIEIDKFKNYFVQWKKHLNRCIASNGEYFEGNWSLNIKNKYTIFYKQTFFLGGVLPCMLYSG